MSATVLLGGVLKEYQAGHRLITVEAGVPVIEILRVLAIPPELVALVLINQKTASKLDLVHDGDQVQLLAVMGGG